MDSNVIIISSLVSLFTVSFTKLLDYVIGQKNKDIVTVVLDREEQLIKLVEKTTSVISEIILLSKDVQNNIDILVTKNEEIIQLLNNAKESRLRCLDRLDTIVKLREER